MMPSRRGFNSPHLHHVKILVNRPAELGDEPRVLQCHVKTEPSEVFYVAGMIPVTKINVAAASSPL
ncbi:MAG: hypothetical protein Q8N84_04490 [bacterium]|nr:hypothetical protein [bacterium]